MLGSLGIIALALLIIFWEKPLLTNKSMKKEQTAFFLLLALGVIVGTAASYNLLPTPLKLIAAFYKPIVAFLGWK
jgi:hypothetical protein